MDLDIIVCLNEKDVVNALYSGSCFKIDSSLKRLSLRFGRLDTKNINALISAFEIGSSLVELNLHGNNIGDTTMIRVLQYLSHTCLKKLFLSGNQLCDSAAIFLSNMIKNTPSLTELYLFGNNISNVGATSLLSAFQNATHLSVLALKSPTLGSNPCDKQLHDCIAQLNVTRKKKQESILNEQQDRQTIDSEETLQYQSAVQVISGFKPTKSCAEEVFSLSNHVGYEKFKFIAQECTSWMKSFKTKPLPTHCNFTLNDDELFALAMYTYDLGLNGDIHENFYWILNKMLQKREPALINLWKPYLFFLQTVLAHFPDYDGTVYRGMKSGNFTDEYNKNRRIHWSGFSSTTSSLQIAQKFAGHDGVIFQINICNGKKISDYSFYNREDEVLLSPNMAFLVIKPLYSKNGYKWIKLCQENPSKTFVF